MLFTDPEDRIKADFFIELYAYLTTGWSRVQIGIEEIT